MLFSCLLPAKQIARPSLLFYWSLFKIIFFGHQNLIRAIWIVPHPPLLFPVQPNFPYFGRNLNEWLVCSSFHLGCLKWKGLAEVSCPAGASQMLDPSPMAVAETVWYSNWKRGLIKVSRWKVCSATHSFIFKLIGAERMTKNTSWFHVDLMAYCSDGLPPVCLLRFLPSFYDLLNSVSDPESSIFQA